MIETPEQPKDSVIVQERRGESIKLSWRTPRRIGPAELMGGLALMVWFVLPVLEERDVIVILGAAAWFALFSGIAVGEYRGQGLHQHVILTPTGIEYSRRPGRSVRVPRDDIRAIRLRGRGWRGRVVVDLGADDIWIGRRIPGPDREWLCEVLRLWHGAADA